MSQNLVEANSQLIEIPHGWQPPKFRFGQPVRIRVPLGVGQYEAEFGVIAGFTYHGANTSPTREYYSDWEYQIALSSDSPNWRFYGGIVIAEEEDIFPAVDSDGGYDQLTTPSVEHREVVLT